MCSVWAHHGAGEGGPCSQMWVKHVRCGHNCWKRAGSQALGISDILSQPEGSPETVHCGYHSPGKLQEHLSAEERGINSREGFNRYVVFSYACLQFSSPALPGGRLNSLLTKSREQSPHQGHRPAQVRVVNSLTDSPAGIRHLLMWHQAQGASPLWLYQEFIIVTES